MGDVNRFFSRWEFACKCGCGFDAVDHVLLMRLTELREAFGKPVRINSGCRCARHNQRAGGARSSYHTRGRAADFTVQDTDPREVWEIFNVINGEHYGLILYINRLHLDTRRTGYRDDKTKGGVA
jgi:uncharacterized protein YcbK (DUF882 family)